MPSNFTELTRSMWPAESWRSGRCDVLFCFVKVDNHVVVVGPDLELVEEKLHISGLMLNTKGLCQGSIVHILVD